MSIVVADTLSPRPASGNGATRAASCSTAIDLREMAFHQILLTQVQYLRFSKELRIVTRRKSVTWTSWATLPRGRSDPWTCCHWSSPLQHSHHRQGPFDVREMAFHQILCTQVQNLCSSKELRIVMQKVGDLDLLCDTTSGTFRSLVPLDL
jgi:hypothetical protein